MKYGISPILNTKISLHVYIYLKNVWWYCGSTPRINECMGNTVAVVPVCVTCG